MALEKFTAENYQFIAGFAQIAREEEWLFKMAEGGTNQPMQNSLDSLRRNVAASIGTMKINLSYQSRVTVAASADKFHSNMPNG